MKIRCINNTALSLKPYEFDPKIKKEVFGRFGVSELAKYAIEIGKEYNVMGIITFQTYIAYLIDDNDYIHTCPCQLFEVVDNKINSNWCFRLIDMNEDIYPFIQAIFGYPELCSNRNAYNDLIIEMEESARKIYFKRKNELE